MDDTLFVYTGQLDDEIDLTGYPTGTLEKSWPSAVIPRVESSQELVIVEPFSFPYEAMTPNARHVPLTVLVPEWFSLETISDLLAEPLFSRLTIFDRVVTDRDEIWARLRSRFGLPEVLRLHMRGRTVREFVDDLVDVRMLLEEADRAYLRPPRQIDRWAVRTVHNKRKHLIQREALEQQVRSARGSMPRGVKMGVSHFGVGVGRFLNLYGDAKVIGFDSTAWVVEQCLYNFERARVSVIGPKLESSIEMGSSDMTIAVHMLTDASPERRSALLSELWRVTRIGGRIVLLDDFGAPEGISARQLVREVFELAGTSIVMADVVNLRYDDTGRIGDTVVSLVPVKPPGGT